MDCTICVAKTKALISFAVTAKLICVFVFAYAKTRFSHVGAQLSLTRINTVAKTEGISLSKVVCPTFQGESKYWY